MAKLTHERLGALREELAGVLTESNVKLMASDLGVGRAGLDLSGELEVRLHALLDHLNRSGGQGLLRCVRWVKGKYPDAELPVVDALQREWGVAPAERGHPPPADPLLPFKTHVRENANCLAGIFTRVGGPQVLSDVYVEVQLGRGREGEGAPHLEKADAPTDRGPQRLEDAVSRTDKRRWILLGDPGAGKTTLLHHLCLHLLDKAEALPIYLKVGDVVDAGSIKKAVAQIYPEDSLPAVTEKLKAGEVVVLLDGLDEALEPTQARTAVMKAHSELSDKATLVVASRKVGYEKTPLPPTFAELHLLELSEGAQLELLTRWTGQQAKARDELTRLRRHDRLARMVGNPLLLTLVGLLLRAGQPVPERRGLLYREALNLLMRREHTVGGKARLLRSPATAERLLAKVALYLHGREREVYPTADVVEVLSKADTLATLKQTWETPESFLEEVALTTGLLVPDRSQGFTARGYTFPHRTFREYLAAVGLEDDIARYGVGAREGERLGAVVGEDAGPSTQTEWSPQRATVSASAPPAVLDPSELARVLAEAKTKPASWSEVLALTCGLLGRGAGDGLVRRVARQGNPELTLRVVAEADGIREDTVDLVLGMDKDPKGWERRKEVLERLPGLVRDAGSAARLIWKFLRGTTNGNDLYWGREVLRAIGRGEVDVGVLGTSDPDRAEAADYAARIFDHLRGERLNQAKALLEAQMLLVQAGEFWMGNTKESDSEARDIEAPRLRVRLSAFRLQKVPVTNALYELFDPGHAAARERWKGISEEELAQHPVVRVSWYEATMFCEWLGGALPTEAQWEYAARGPESKKYPWGDSPRPTTELANFGAKLGRTSPVGSYPGGASWVGAMDMAGNVLEWCQDWYGEYGTGEQTNPTGPEAGSDRVVRGGSWFDDAGGLRAAVRSTGLPDHRSFSIGFRVVVPVGAPSPRSQ